MWVMSAPATPADVCRALRTPSTANDVSTPSLDAWQRGSPPLESNETQAHTIDVNEAAPRLSVLSWRQQDAR